MNRPSFGKQARSVWGLACYVFRPGLVTTVLLILANATLADPVRLLSARDGAAALPLAANGNSVAPLISADGRFVLFVSSANDLVPGGKGQFELDLFLRDRASNTTVLVSANLAGDTGGNGSSLYASMSQDGRYVSFQSQATDLLPGDTNGVTDVFVRDLRSGTTELVSVAADGSWANGSSSDPVITPDGRFVAFLSSATNLVPGDTNGIQDVFVRDRVNHTTTLVSVGSIAPGDMAAPQISPDGRFVAFSSRAKGLAAGVPANSNGEVYVRDLVGGLTTWVSTNAAAFALAVLHSNNPASYHPAMSSDGRWFAFKTGPTNGVGVALVLQYDAASGSTTLVSSNAVPAPAYNDDLYGPETTADGRRVTFVVTNSLSLAVAVWDSQTGTTTLVSADPLGNVPSNTVSYAPVITADEHFIAFLSNATNLVPETVSAGFHLYLYDSVLNTNRLVDADTNGVGSSDLAGGVPSLSADGGYIAFDRPDGGLVSGDNNGASDVFVRDLVHGSTELVSRRYPGLPSKSGSGLSTLPAVSITADDRWVVFSSTANDLITNDFNADEDVFLWDSFAGSISLVSVGLDGNAASGGYSGNPVISADGRFVAFVSAATNLVGGSRNIFLQVYVRDMWEGTNVLLSVGAGGTSPGNGSSWAPVMSQDGRYVAFVSQANNLAGGAAGMFWRDLRGGTLTLLPGSTAAGIGPVMSPDGRFVAYSTSGSVIRVWDSQTSGYQQLGTLGSVAVINLALSPGGRQLAYHGANRLVITDLDTASNLLSCISLESIRSPAQWSGNGRFFAFTTASSLVAPDTNGFNDVYLFELATSNLTLVSKNLSNAASANGASDWPLISADGQSILFRTVATDLAPGTPANSPSLVRFDRASGSNALVATPSPAGDWSSWLSAPSVSRDGGLVAFQSWSSGFGGGDLNRAADVFAAISHPVILMDQPVLAGSVVQLNFDVTIDTLTSFTLLQTEHLGDPWVPNLAATLSTNSPGASYRFTVPFSSAVQFYRVQSP